MFRSTLSKPRSGAKSIRQSTLVLLLTLCSLLSLGSAANATTTPLSDEPPPEWTVPIQVRYHTGTVSWPTYPLSGVKVCYHIDCAETDERGIAEIKLRYQIPGPIPVKIEDRKGRVLSRYTSFSGLPIFLTPACRGQKANIVGTPWADNRQGTQGNDVVQLMGGNDSFSGLGGSDTVCGSDGNDKLWGNQGNDRLYGDAGNDHLGGGVGDDLLVDRSGQNLLNGGAGFDTCRGGDSRTLACERS